MSVVDFFATLSERFSKENDLSDVTYTMCMASDFFKERFIHFFFPDVDISHIYIEREKAQDDSRPDFYLESGDDIYLIECKIYDKNQHFEQYISRFHISPKQLGYITNYKLLKQGFETKTWAEFKRYLEKEVIPENEEDLINGYIEYLTRVCSITNITSKMTLSGMNSLYTFYTSLSDVVSVSNEQFDSKEYDSRRDTNGGGNVFCTPRDGAMGKYFELNIKGRRYRKAWGWIGVYFAQEEPTICIGFDNRQTWGWHIYNKLSPLVDSFEKGEKFSKPYFDGDGNVDAIWFDFTAIKKFETTEKDQQIQLLREFYIEVINSIIETINSNM